MKKPTKESVYQRSKQKIGKIDLGHIRPDYGKVDWNNRLIGLEGARGVGKTTIMLQYLKQTKDLTGKAVYVTLDDVYFAENSLYDFAEDFLQTGGTHLFIDEVHKYSGWSIEIKNLYDAFPELNMVFTGSSIIHLLKGKADLSRRAVIYHIAGLSFREYLKLAEKIDFPAYSLQDILERHEDIALEITKSIRPLVYFNDYLQGGYYPFFLENRDTYLIKLEQVMQLTLELDLPYLLDIPLKYVDKLKRLLFILSQNVPFKPNIQKLSTRIELTRNTTVQYLHYLEKASLLALLHSQDKGMSLLQKPEMVYLDNPNLFYVLATEAPDNGALRESFFLNQLRVNHKVNHTPKADFMVNEKYIFEVGGKYKTYNQIADVPHFYIAMDGIEVGIGNKIPLWLFGFMH